jgi:hypothetical protein
MDLIRDVRLEIDELIFTGLGALDAASAATVFERELTRLVRSHGLPLDALRPDRIAEALAGLPPLPTTGSARRFGNALAGALFAGLAGNGSSAAPVPTPVPAPVPVPQRPATTRPQPTRSAP